MVPVTGGYYGMKVDIVLPVASVTQVALPRSRPRNLHGHVRENLPDLARISYPGAGTGVVFRPRGPDVYVAKEGTLSDEESQLVMERHVH